MEIRLQLLIGLADDIVREGWQRPGKHENEKQEMSRCLVTHFLITSSAHIRNCVIYERLI